MRSEKIAKSLLDYVQKHPEQRFWQALRNWAREEESPDIAMVLVATGFGVNPVTGEYEYSDIEDTFNWE